MGAGVIYSKVDSTFSCSSVVKIAFRFYNSEDSGFLVPDISSVCFAIIGVYSSSCCFSNTSISFSISSSSFDFFRYREKRAMALSL